MCLVLVLTCNAIQTRSFIGVNVGTSIAIIFAQRLASLVVVRPSPTIYAQRLASLVVVRPNITFNAQRLASLVDGAIPVFSWDTSVRI